MTKLIRIHNYCLVVGVVVCFVIIHNAAKRITKNTFWTRVFQYSCRQKTFFDVIFPFILPMISITHTGPQPFVFRFVSFVPCSGDSSFFKLLGKKWEKIETDKKESIVIFAGYCIVIRFCHWVPFSTTNTNRTSNSWQDVIF